MLLDFAAKTMVEDEHKIPDGYRHGQKVMFVGVLILGASMYWGELKHVVGAGAFLTFVAVIMRKVAFSTCVSGCGAPMN